MDLAAGRLLKHGVRVKVRRQSFEVLSTLLTSPGQVVTREELRRQLWPDDVFVDFETGLNSAMGRLREALGDSSDRPLYIETLPRHGYRFIAAVSASEVNPPKITPRCRLLVLPFINASGDPAQEYLSEALTDEIIGALAQSAPDALAVIARTTAMHYRGTHKDVAHIARELSVDHVVEGSVRPSASAMVVNVQLIWVSDQAHVWSGRYETSPGDLFSLRHAIADTITEKLCIPCARELQPTS